jgi:hypothetical protein
MPKLTEKEKKEKAKAAKEQKVRKIVTDGIAAGLMESLVLDAMKNPTLANLKAAQKAVAKTLKALTQGIAVLAPEPKA